jgi:hypothetical protein
VSGHAKRRLVSTPATDRAMQGRRLAASTGPVTAGRFPRRQGALRAVDGTYRAPRPGASAANGYDTAPRQDSTAFGHWADLAAASLPEGIPQL